LLPPAAHAGFFNCPLTFHFSGPRKPMSGGCSPDAFFRTRLDELQLVSGPIFVSRSVCNPLLTTALLLPLVRSPRRPFHQLAFKCSPYFPPRCPPFGWLQTNASLRPSPQVLCRLSCFFLSEASDNPSRSAKPPPAESPSSALGSPFDTR